MRKQTLLGFTALLGAVSSMEGKIVEVESFEELAQHITPQTLILLDIDDTLIIPAQMLGGYSWFFMRWKQHEVAGMDKSLAFEKTIAEWEAIRHLTKMKTVEEETPIFIQNLQKNGYQVMGLTHQGLALATRTVQQLGENQIDLSVTAPAREDYFFNFNGHGILYHKRSQIEGLGFAKAPGFNDCKRVNIIQY